MRTKVVFVCMILSWGTLWADEGKSEDSRIENLRKMILEMKRSHDKEVKALRAEIERLKEGPDRARDATGKGIDRAIDEAIERMRKRADTRENALEERVSDLTTRVDEIDRSALFDVNSWLNKFTLGGYGEMHANFQEGKGADMFDIHRFVLYLGYDFTDWIKFHSETEIEHAFVSSGSGGELSLEQAYVDFSLSDPFNVRVGRVLTPLGIINKKHEPPTFHGVERPAFAKYIIPSTWSSDGLGIFGNLSPALKYEAYVVGGLDGSKFDDLDGIRPGRIKERPSLHDPAFTGRLDYYPFVDFPVGGEQTLRLGASTYVGGLDDANKGKNPGMTQGHIEIYSGDFEYSISRFDFRGAIAVERIFEAQELPVGVAQEIFGYYVEAGYHFWPDAWMKGKLAQSDAVLFGRFDNFDTQYKMPQGVAKNPAGNRYEWTVGVNFYLTPSFVLKADWQWLDDESGSTKDIGNLLNFGVGWQF